MTVPSPFLLELPAHHYGVHVENELGTQATVPFNNFSCKKENAHEVKIFLGVFATGVLTFSFVHAAPPNWRSVDVTHLDVASVELGMSYDQALAAITKHFQLSSNEIKRVQASTIYSYSRITNSQQPISTRYTKDNTTLELSFSVRIPVNPSNPMAVSRIHYGIPNTKENVAMLKESSLSKYGQPSDNRRQASLMWCAHYNQIAQCEPSKPKLSLILGSLVLNDPTLEEAGRKYEQNLLKTKPNI